uniref:MRN complex-interacting protein N-terminal domain-containing protein n=1 Tax=Anser cygnoides TaxID=8845 RepID=A0A8B9D5R1_ANSCY
MAAPCWVLRCCSCRLFQAQQAKRSAKWSCSVCGQRQALLKVYGRGSGRDCRHHVQKLNSLQVPLPFRSRLFSEVSQSQLHNLAVYMQCFRVKLWEESSVCSLHQKELVLLFAKHYEITSLFSCLG